jgi:hypothetical protein
MNVDTFVLLVLYDRFKQLEPLPGEAFVPKAAA